MLRVVLVEPLYPINIGAVARVMNNFGLKQLWLVKPRTEISEESFKFAKHAGAILENARIVKNLSSAIRDCDFVVGTTGVVPRFKYALKSCITPRELAEKINKRDKVALLFGNEGTGMTLQQLKECDAIVSIPASRAHPVLNLSHAVAIVLYELFLSRKRWTHYRAAKRGSIRNISKMFRKIISGMGHIRDKQKVARAFENALRRSRISEEELKALFAAVSGMRKHSETAH